MEAKSQWKYARITPQKARMVADALRGKPLAEAYEIMQIVPRKGCPMFKKVVDAAVSNLRILREGEDVDPDLLFIKEIWADKGPVWKRWIPRAMGRATRINKFTSHLNVIVAEK